MLNSFKFWQATPNGFEYLGSVDIEDISPAHVEQYVCMWGDMTATKHPVILAVCDELSIAYEFEASYR